MNSIGSALTILDDKYIRTHRYMNVLVRKDSYLWHTLELELTTKEVI